jgi:hypothetical protein
MLATPTTINQMTAIRQSCQVLTVSSRTQHRVAKARGETGDRVSFELLPKHPAKPRRLAVNLQIMESSQG